ncbi:MAG TPA: hypothetical protein VNO33_18375, partial [Kofleriaceae bacterium]|nr:hypothetical protein [Kofleriaceae bacterium]
MLDRVGRALGQSVTVAAVDRDPVDVLLARIRAGLDPDRAPVRIDAGHVAVAEPARHQRAHQRAVAAAQLQLP